MLLLLKRPAAKETALQQFLQDAHTPGGAKYHAWLTPEQFAAQFGPADADVATVTGWLRAQGFTVARISKGKTAIEFSGTAAQVTAAFNTEIHTYQIGAETHHANNRDPQIPAALAPLVAGITALNDFAPRSNAIVLGSANYSFATHQFTPEWTFNSTALALAPGDFRPAVRFETGLRRWTERSRRDDRDHRRFERGSERGGYVPLVFWIAAESFKRGDRWTRSRSER